MKALDPQISELCRRVKITDYLRQKGVNLIKGGNRWRCLCPLPDHKDHDPSFYIRNAPDGAEIFTCFGCSRKGNILTLMSMMEGESKGKIIKKIAAQAGIILARLDFSAARIEPLPEYIDEIFCDEQFAAGSIAGLTVSLMQENPTEDLINKISRMYEMLDKMTRIGDNEGIERYLKLLDRTIDEY